MALPVAPRPRNPDVAVTGWSAITIRVAWTLLCASIRVRPHVLRDARDHVLYHLEPGSSVARADDRAEALGRGFVALARRERLHEPWPQDLAMPLSPRWRRALEESLTPLSLAVFRQHYGDSRPIEELERALQVDRVALEGVRGGLREVIRRVGADDGLPILDWSNDRIDALLHRLAAFVPAACPPVDEVLAGEHAVHAGTCVRCTRALRLVKVGVLTGEELVPPLGQARPPHRVRVLALHFHPDGRRHRARLAREAGGASCPVADDLLLLDLAQPEAVTRALLLATELAAPSRDHLRGVVLEGPGRWSRHGLLGPLAEQATQAVRSRSWGTVESVGDLPGPLPPPPSARRAWMAVAVLGLLAVASARAAFDPTPPPVDHPLTVEFVDGRGGVWVQFDVDDRALVTLVRATSEGLDVVLASQAPADKAPLAVGDGSFRVHAVGKGVLLAATSRPLPDLGPLLAAARAAEDPLGELAARIRTADPGADVQRKTIGGPGVGSP